MSTEHLPRLAIDFLEDSVNALRRVTQSNYQLECLICSRLMLPESLAKPEGRKALDAPGVYLLIGPVNGQDNRPGRNWRLYVGQADSVADRLGTHLKSDGKTWVQTVVVIKRPENCPLNLSQCRVLESKLCVLAADADACVLVNKNAPQPSVLSKAEQAETEELLQKAILIVSALGWNFFEPKAPPTKPDGPDGPPPVPPHLRQLFGELRQALTPPSLPKAEWYWTHTPDYRAKVVIGGDFRVFASVVAKNWVRIELKDVAVFKIGDLADLENHRDSIRTAYDKAEKYLQRGR